LTAQVNQQVNGIAGDGLLAADLEEGLTVVTTPQLNLNFQRRAIAGGPLNLSGFVDVLACEIRLELDLLGHRDFTDVDFGPQSLTLLALHNGAVQCQRLRTTKN